MIKSPTLFSPEDIRLMRKAFADCEGLYREIRRPDIDPYCVQVDTKYDWIIPIHSYNKLVDKFEKLDQVLRENEHITIDLTHLSPFECDLYTRYRRERYGTSVNPTGEVVKI